jgi:hypothetical protein
MIHVTLRTLLSICNARILGLGILAMAVFCIGIDSVAQDVAIYECTSSLGSELAKGMKDLMGDDPDMAAASAAFTVHPIYKFDYVNNTISFRALNNKGEDSSLLGMGAATKYTVPFTRDPNGNVTWTKVTDFPDGSGTMTERYTFDAKTYKLHSVMTMASAKATAEAAQPLEEDLTCTVYTAKKH